MAEKLFLSKHTINKHRNNILEKTGKAHISDLIHELKELGILYLSGLPILSALKTTSRYSQEKTKKELETE
jgi:hypothetical protein